MSRILVIEDEESLREILKYNLDRNNFETVCAEDANEALLYLEELVPDLILLDLMLPGLKGGQFLKIVKDNPKYASIPVIVVSAKNSEEEIITALESGAEDFITKPFNIKILLAKVKVIIKRSLRSETKIVVYKDIELDSSLRSVKVGAEEINLTHKEFELLHFLITNPKRVFTRNQLLSNIWGYDSDIYTRTVDSHISSLRKKLKSSGNVIKSLPKIGYKVE